MDDSLTHFGFIWLTVTSLIGLAVIIVVVRRTRYDPSGPRRHRSWNASAIATFCIGGIGVLLFALFVGGLAISIGEVAFGIIMSICLTMAVLDFVQHLREDMVDDDEDLRADLRRSGGHDI